jgi:hypothetical protein
VLLENVECGSPDLILLDFYLWGAVKNDVYTSKQRTLQDLRREIETECAAVPLATMSGNLLYVVVNNALLLVVVDILNICDCKCENITMLSLFICELKTLKV